MTENPRPEDSERTSVTPAERINYFAGYLLIPVLSLVTPFLIFPILARTAGIDSWVAIAIGQSIGAFVGLGVSAGLNVVGPTLIAQADTVDRVRLLCEGTRARLLLLPIGLIVAVPLASLISPPSTAGSAVAMAVAMVIASLSPSWYLIGAERPLAYVLIDLVPKALATGLGALMLIATGSAIWYPILLALVSGATSIGYVIRVVGLRRLLQRRIFDALSVLRRVWESAVTELVAGLYSTLPVALVGAAAPPAQTASYVSGDKLFKVGQLAIGTAGNAFQARVVSGGQTLRAARTRTAITFHAVLGGLGFVAFATLGPTLTALLFGAEVALDYPTAVWFGVAALALSLNTCLGRHVLMSSGRQRAVLVSVAIGASIGLPTFVVMAGLFGAQGGAIALAMTESLVLAIQTAAIFILRQARYVRGRPNSAM